MSAHVLLNVLNDYFVSLFCNEFHKLNNTGARMLDFIDHMTLTILKHCIFGVKKSSCSPLLRNVIMDVNT